MQRSSVYNDERVTFHSFDPSERVTEYHRILKKSGDSRIPDFEKEENLSIKEESRSSYDELDDQTKADQAQT